MRRLPTLLLLILVMPTGAHAQDDGAGLAKIKEQELEEVRDKISDLKKSMDKSARDRDRLTEDLQSAEVGIAEKRLRLKDLERERAWSGKRLAELDAAIAEREAELAFEAVGQVADLAAERGVKIVISPEMPTVSGDRAQLLTVLRQLLENGGRFLGDQPAPRLEVGWRREDEEAVFFVRDNGRGLDSRDHERVFALFERLVPEDEGDGIGLALVKRIVEAHGGRVWAESGGVGQGSAFCFTLPRGA